MSKVLEYLIIEFLTYPVTIFLQGKIMNKKIKFDRIRFYIGVIIFTIMNYINFVIVDGFVSFFVCWMIMIISSSFIFDDKIDKVFYAVTIQQILYFISELILSVLLEIINNIFAENQLTLNSIFLNLLVVIIAILLFFVPMVKSTIKKITKFFDRLTGIVKYILVLFFIITLNILLMGMYYNSGNKILMIANIFFIIVYSFIIYQFLNEKSENIKYKEQNKMLIDNLNEYEKMLDYQRVNNHENKNQLLVIQGMIDKTNTKALEYLDEVIKEKREDDEGIYTSASIIPQGGLQGLIYQKMLKMKENNIIINLKVERKVRKINFDDLPSKTNYDLCRAVGIIIDNAIEENLNLKEREILICMYILDEYLVIEVSNKCSVIPDMTRLDEKGYTTKSNGHGYGLSLLKEIVDSNKNIINERSINKDIFTQIIKIKK